MIGGSFPLKLRSDGSLATPRNQIFPVIMEQTGGSQGTATTAASWTYTVKDTDGTSIATGVDPVASPHKCTRPNLGQVAKATFGQAFFAGNSLVVISTNEAVIQGACA